MVYDVAIIGLGPAGAILAMQLDKKLNVIALDKKSNEVGSFKKPCGGLLSPDAQKAMAKLNLNLPKEILVNPQIFYVKTLDLVSGAARDYQRFYLNMDRHKYDCWLKSLIPENVVVQDGCLCKSVSREDGLFKAEYVKEGKTEIIYAKTLVGSDGANSTVRKLVTSKTPPKYIAIQEWFESKDSHAFYTCMFDKTITKNYAYSVTKDDYYLLCGIFAVDNGKSAFENLKKKLDMENAVPVKREACLVFKPRKFSDFCTGAEGVFLIGEAAGFISPSSLEGISYAIESASDLSAVLNGKYKNKNKAYKKKSLKIRIKLMLKHLKSLFIGSPFFRNAIMKSGLLSIAVCKSKGERK